MAGFSDILLVAVVKARRVDGVCAAAAARRRLWIEEGAVLAAATVALMVLLVVELVEVGLRAGVMAAEMLTLARGDTTAAVALQRLIHI